MKIHLGEFLNLMHNHPVFDGDTISRRTMNELLENGLAVKTSKGFIPNERGRKIYNKLTCEEIDIREEFYFQLSNSKQENNK